MSDIQDIDPDEFRNSYEMRVAAIRAARSANFRDIIEAARMKPETDLMFGDFSGCDFSGQNLAGYNFTGCDLTDATFGPKDEQSKAPRAKIDGAIFDSANVELKALRGAADYKIWLANQPKRDAASRYFPSPGSLRALDTFRESPFAPEMVVIPAGSFLMGSDAADLTLPDDSPDKAYDDEVARGKGKPAGKRRMAIPRRFALARTPVTFDEFAVFCEAEGRKRPTDKGWGKGARPVINVSWDDARAYIDWLNKMLGAQAYGLPSEAQWEYACRAGTNTRRWWGDAWDPARANGDDSFEKGKTSPVDHYPANPWGLRDMIGNVWEWCADIYVDNIGDLPEDGSAYETKEKGNKSQGRRSLRGGSWINGPRFLRAADRDGDIPGFASSLIGFRVARTLNP